MTVRTGEDMSQLARDEKQSWITAMKKIQATLNIATTALTSWAKL